MKFFKSVWLFWVKNGTKLLGYIGTAQTLLIGAMSIEGLIPTSQLKYWLFMNLVINVLTVKRGHTNTATIKDEIRSEVLAKEEVKVQDAAQEIRDERSGISMEKEGG